MPYLIDRIKQSLAKEGLQPRTNLARLWLKQKVENLKPTPQSVMADRNRLKNRSFVGRMYFYFYDPITKDVLPYYDKFPLVIPIEQYPDGFLGLNLHYIHPKQRIILLDKLSDTLNNKKFNDTTKMKVNYNYLKNASRVFEAMPCIKRYFYSNVKSRFLEISADEWDIAALLPVSNFVNASPNKVYAESRKKF